jgi:hypothetical protein
MSQPIAGVVPPELAEAPLMTVWPSIGANRLGRWIGRMCAVSTGFGSFFTLGKLLALLLIPLALGAYFWRLMPYICRRYLLTTRRIIICKGLNAVPERWINLDEFDRIEVEVLPGQAWLRAAEVRFLRGNHELLRLSGVPHPQVFRQACLKARDALLLVRKHLHPGGEENIAAVE